MAYDLKDAKQAAIGTIVAVLFFYLLKAGETIAIDPMKGLIIGLIWLIIVGSPLWKNGQEAKTHFTMNVLVAIIISSLFAIFFEMVTMDQLLSFQFFGTSAWLGMLLGLTAAQFYDKNNITDVFSTRYHKK